MLRGRSRETTRSGLPSLFISPMTASHGPAATAIGEPGAGANNANCDPPTPASPALQDARRSTERAGAPNVNTRVITLKYFKCPPSLRIKNCQFEPAFRVDGIKLLDGR